MNRYKLYITAGLALASLFAAPAINSLGPVQKSYLADGSPLPPVPPRLATANSSLVADGSPLPPVPPGSTGHGFAEPQLIADGSPLPPVPPKLANALLVS